MRSEATTDRRRHPRTISRTTAVIKTNASLHRYEVSNLSVSGALLVGGPPLHEGALVEVLLHIPLYPDIRIAAKVVHAARGEDGMRIGIEFIHKSDFTEDHIQAALLSELERSQTHGLISEVLS
jgi:hypothetical protein